MLGKALVWIGGLFGVALVGSAVAFGPALLSPPSAVELKAEPGCDLQRGPCSVSLPGGGTMTLSLGPRPIPVMSSVAVKVSFSDVQAREVAIDFKGVDMNMGYNHFVLTGGEDGHFSGTAVLPVCIRNRMLWDAWVLAATDDGRFTAPFRFETRHP